MRQDFDLTDVDLGVEWTEIEGEVVVLQILLITVQTDSPGLIVEKLVVNELAVQEGHGHVGCVMDAQEMVPRVLLTLDQVVAVAAAAATIMESAALAEAALSSLKTINNKRNVNSPLTFLFSSILRLLYSQKKKLFKVS